ncbi:MAG: hypothetical protein M5U08_25690 [Burkholderiales bacterium]|nr:hypothetical protein [Burkholderiales bacterium]
MLIGALPLMPPRRDARARARERHDQAGERHQDRHCRDVRHLGPEHQALGVLAQVLAHVLQLAARLDDSLAEALELGLLLGAQDLGRLRRRAARLLQRLELLVGLGDLVLERLDLAEVLLLRPRPRARARR